MLKEKFKDFKIYLATQSPRRHSLVEGLDLDFGILNVEVDEVYPHQLKKNEIATYLAELKADAIDTSKLPDNYIIITADTIVWLNDHILTKPINFDDAFRILSELSGVKHEVFTGVCIKTKEKKLTFYAHTDVYFKKLSKAEIIWYIDNYKPYDKAGAYGAQEWIGYIAIERIEGSYFNVMGLPIHQLYNELLKF